MYTFKKVAKKSFTKSYLSFFFFQLQQNHSEHKKFKLKIFQNKIIEYLLKNVSCDDRLNSESGVKIKYAAENTSKKIATFQLFTLRGMLRPPKTNTKCLRRRKVKGL